MTRTNRDIQGGILIVGDLVAAYLALFLTLYIRYGSGNFAYIWSLHALPFAAVFMIWLIMSFIVGLDNIDELKGRFTLVTKTAEGLAATFLLSLGMFYLIPYFQITPKANLVFVTIAYAMCFLAWRLMALHIFSRTSFRSRVVFLGSAPEVGGVCNALIANPHLGYSCAATINDISETIPPCDIIVVSHHLGKDELTPALYARFFESTTIIDLPTFYEKIHRSVAESALSREWVLTNLAQRESTVFDQLKRPFDAILAAIAGIPTLLVSPFIALAVRLSGPGPVLFSQDRVGRGGRVFKMHKFRTMRVDAEKDGAAFAAESDPRVTPVGRFLRKTRLDELPQLWNILKGEMSFVGPRPERPEFEAVIAKSIPLFPVRHLVRPGLTGWAQVNAPYAASTEDHMKKLLLDLYYLKERSTSLDAAILLRTVYSVLKHKGR